MQCPKCHRFQEETYECVYCGVIMPKYAQMQEEERAKRLEEAARKLVKKHFRVHPLAPCVYGATIILCLAIVAVLLWPKRHLVETRGETLLRQRQTLVVRIENTTLPELDALARIVYQRNIFRKEQNARTKLFMEWAPVMRKAVENRRALISGEEFEYTAEEKWLGSVEANTRKILAGMRKDSRGIPVDLPALDRKELFSLAGQWTGP
jgi:hypothetical protein